MCLTGFVFLKRDYQINRREDDHYSTRCYHPPYHWNHNWRVEFSRLKFSRLILLSF